MSLLLGAYVCFLVVRSRNDVVSMLDFRLKAKKMRSAFFRDVMQHVVVLFTDVSEQTVDLIFKDLGFIDL